MSALPPPDAVIADALALAEKAKTLEELYAVVAGVPATSPTPDAILYTAGAASDAIARAQEATGYSLIDDTKRAELLNDARFFAKVAELAGMATKDPGRYKEMIESRVIPAGHPETAAILRAKELIYGRTGDPESLKNSFWGRASEEFARSVPGEIVLLVGDRLEAAKRVFWGVELPALLENPGERRINGVPVAALSKDPDIAFEQLKQSGQECSTGFGDPAKSKTPGGQARAPSAGGGGGGGAGMPAARMGDMHVCPMVTVLVPHVGGPVAIGCPTVLIGGQPAARVGDMAVCVGPPDVIVLGSFKVLIGGMPAARLGDMTAHGGAVVMGLPTVMIG